LQQIIAAAFIRFSRQSSSDTGFLNLWATEEFLTGRDLVLLELSAFCKVNL